MIVLIIIIAILLLIFVVPYGVDVAYESGVLRLGVKAGLFRFWLLPKKHKTEKQLKRQQEKDEKKRARQEAKVAQKAAAKAEQEKNQTQTVKPRKSLDIQFILALVKMGIRAVRRFFRSFAIDFLRLHYVAATSDPYDTAVQYSYICGALAALPEIAGDVIRVRKKDVQVGMDFTVEKPTVAARIVVSLQLYKIVCVAAAFAVEFVQWKMKHRDPKAGASERKDDNGREQDQRNHGCNNEQDQAAC